MIVKSSHTKRVGIAAAIGVVTLYGEEAKSFPPQVGTVNLGKSISIGSSEVVASVNSTMRVKVPVECNDASKIRFKKLMLLKASKKATEEEAIEFSELYEAREAANDHLTADQRIKEYRRVNALKNLLSAFDHYVQVENIPS